ncbi:DUF262 domain-containing protein [Acetobacterium fimetarium]|nr:DUF262 domain-containing protein [Acetobacterium fimetarium]
MNRNIGQLLSFVQLLQLDEMDNISIPVIQRDYAQGRIDTQATEIRNDFVLSLRNALEMNEPLTLDCIYGSISERNFIPTDGQQRLTTLFLLHYYVSVAAGKLDSALLSKFTYMVRDSAKEFCESLATHSIDLSTKNPSLSIKNALWYHGGVFENDPTINGMLNMLDEIHVKFGTESALEYHERLFKDESPVKFWWLPIDNFGFADDLFIKMNARGKSLTRFEVFKAEFETAITESGNADQVHEWKEKIDNDWLELFWQYFGVDAPNNAENGLFRYILFIGETFHSWQKKSVFVSKSISEDNDRLQYRNTITVFQTPNYFEFLCASLDGLGKLINSSEFTNCKEFFKALVTGNNLEFWKYAKLFSVISFNVKFGAMGNFVPFMRVLDNLIAYQREINKRDMIFNTAIDGVSYQSFTNGIENLLLHMNTCGGDVPKALQTVQSISGVSGLSNEKIKAIYISKHGASEILKLEQIPEMCGLIHNFIESDKIMITADKLVQVVMNKRVFMQLLQSYSPDEMLLLRVGYLWPMVFGEENSKTYRKHRMWFNKSENGDFMFTAAPGDTKKWQAPLKALIADLSTMPFEDIVAEMEELLHKRINSVKFTEWFDYIVKYPEFFVSDEYCCCMIPEYYGGTGYLCLVTDKNWNSPYNPFCKALANKLGVPYKVSGDVKNILHLPNNITAEITNDGGWSINSEDISEVLPCSAGQDCIMLAVDYLTTKIV